MHIYAYANDELSVILPKYYNEQKKIISRVLKSNNKIVEKLNKHSVVFEIIIIL